MELKVIFYILILYNFYSCSAQNHQIRPLFNCSPKLEQPYGICSHVDCTEETKAIQEIKAMKSLGVECVRTDFGPYDFKIIGDSIVGANRISKIVHALEEQEFRLLTIAGASSRSWALSDTSAYYSFLYQLLDMYPKVPYWEILNEVDLGRNIDNKVERYSQLLRNSYNAIKTKDSSKSVLYSGVTPSSMEFNDSVFNYLQNQCFDIMNMHTYSEPEEIFEELKSLKQVLAKHNLYSPVWITECGYPTAAKNLGERKTKEIEQAIRLPRIYLVCFASGVDKVFWYNSVALENKDDYIEDHFGILHKDCTEKLACQSLRTLMRMCPSGSDRPKISIIDGIYVCDWRKPRGQHVYAVWSLQKTSRKLLIKGKYNSYDYNGNEIEVDPSNLQINKQVKYFVGNRKFSFSLQ